MNILFAPVLLLAFMVNLFFTSKLAQILNAQRYQMLWIFLTWLLGTVLTFGFALLNFDIPIVLISMLIIFTLLYNLISGMDMGSAIIVNIASLASIVVLIALTFNFFGQDYIPSIKAQIAKTGLIQVEQQTPHPSEVATAKTASSTSQNNAFTNKVSLDKNHTRFVNSYNRVSLDRAYQFKGRPIRIRKTDSSMLYGTLLRTSRDSLIIRQLHRQTSNYVTSAIRKSSIQLLEAQY